jgi:peptidoglycan/LPS O-acetylase OafA/YrhL
MTEKLLSPLRTRPWPERWLTRTLGATLATTAYTLCVPSGSVPASDDVSGAGWPTLAVILLLLAGYFGRRDDLAWPLLLVAGPPAVLMYVSFESEQPLAWAFATLMIAAGTLIAATVGRCSRPREEEPTDGVLCTTAHRS